MYLYCFKIHILNIYYFCNQKKRLSIRVFKKSFQLEGLGKKRGATAGEDDGTELGFIGWLGLERERPREGQQLSK